VNYDLPNVAEDYVHRIGRTGRASQTGQAISLVSADEIEYLEAIEYLIQKHIEREYIAGYEPNHVVPESRDIRPPSNKKPKKPKLRNEDVTQNAPNKRKPKVKSPLSNGNQRRGPKPESQTNGNTANKPSAKSPWDKTTSARSKGPSKRPVR